MKFSNQETPNHEMQTIHEGIPSPRMLNHPIDDDHLKELAQKVIKCIRELQKCQDCCFFEGYEVKNGYPQKACHEILDLMRSIIFNPMSARQYGNEAMEALECIYEYQNCNFQRGADDAFWGARKYVQKILKLV